MMGLSMAPMSLLEVCESMVERIEDEDEFVVTVNESEIFEVQVLVQVLFQTFHLWKVHGAASLCSEGRRRCH